MSNERSGSSISDTIQILLVEHDLDVARRVREALAQTRSAKFELAHIRRVGDACERLNERRFDVILLDLALPVGGGLNGFQKIQAQASGTPIIVLADQDDREVAVQAESEGAQDYLFKGQEEERWLVRTVNHVIERHHLSMRLEQNQKKLKVSEAQFRNIIEKNADGVVIVDRRGMVRFINPAAELLFGEELLGDSFGFPLVVGETTENIVRGEKQTATVEMRVVETDWEGEQVYLASLRDITEREQAAESLNKRDREREAIIKVASALRTAPTRADMMPIILDQVLELLDATGSALAMCNGQTMVELGRGKWANYTGTQMPLTQEKSHQTIQTGEPYVNNNVQHDPIKGDEALFGDLPAVACVPLITKEQTIGALWVGRDEPISNEDVRLLIAIGNMTANAIHRATLHEQTELRLRRLGALRNIDLAITASLDLRVTFNVVLDQVTTQLDVHAASLLLLNQDTQTLEHASDRGFRETAITRTQLRLGQGHAGRAALERRLISVENLAESEEVVARAKLLKAERFVAYFAVPLVAKGQVKGILEIFHRDSLSPDSEWLDFLDTLAGQAAIAIDNATLFDDLQRSNIELKLAYDTTLEGWSRALDLRDKETEGHTHRVTEMTLKLARTMGIAEDELIHVRRGALLHDMGKMGVPDRILLKPGPLDDGEWKLMRQHPSHAYKMLAPITYLRPALNIPYCHHEKWDGTGYPRGLKGDQIPLEARIFAVVDVWDALRSDRPYRSAWPKDKVRDHIQSLSGQHLHPEVVEAFLDMNFNGSLR